jgi:hypothetical protein
VLPLHTLVLLLGLVFCVASPLIAPVTLLYFVSSSVTQRYQWIYIYRHPYEGAGTLWRQVFNQVRGAAGLRHAVDSVVAIGIVDGTDNRLSWLAMIVSLQRQPHSPPCAAHGRPGSLCISPHAHTCVM